jgi:hypothetical protein
MRQLATTCTLLLTISLLPGWAQQDVITTAIGGGPNDIPALQSDLSGPWGVALDTSGNYYFAAGNRVFKVNTTTLILTVVAGTGVAGYSGDNVSGGALNAQLDGPAGIAVDSSGSVYVAEYNNYVVRMIDTKTNTVTTIAGVQGQCNYNGDGAPATNYHLCHPQGLALDSSGNLYIGDSGNYRVRKLVPSDGTYTISTYAGTGSAGYSGDGESATSAKLNWPAGLALDGAGDLFIADQNNFRIREVTFSTGIITTACGNGTEGNSGTEIGYVYNGIAVNTAGTTVTLGDVTYSEVRQCAVGGEITVIAGTGTAGFSGDGGLATLAEIHTPDGIAITNSGLIYFSDSSNNRIRAFTVGEDINTVAGNGSTTFPTLVSGVPPSGVVLNDPYDVLEDPSGNVFISEYSNCIVREVVKATGLVNIFAGTVATASNATTGTCGFSGEGGPATSAELGNVEGLARDSLGNIYIADNSNCVVWQINESTNDISVFAGATPKDCGYSGDGGPPASAKLDGPAGLFVDRNNNLYIADSANNRIREISGGIINTIAGNGTAGYLGDGDPATSAELNSPRGVAVDSAGNVYIADYDNCVIREVTAATGIIKTIAGIGPTGCNFNGDGTATEHELNHPDRVHLDANDNLFIADDTGQRVRWVSPQGVMTTIAGNGTIGFIGDGGPATSAEFDYIGGIAQDANGDFLVADYDNLRIREVSVFSALNTSPASLDFGLVTVGSTGTPQTMTPSALGPLTFSNISITGPFTEYDNCGTGLSNAATCTMDVYFKPTAAGDETGTITIDDNGFFIDSTSINLTGTGSAISVTGGPLLFGNQAVKTASAVKTVTVTNKGTATITMGTVTVDETDFVIASNKCTSGLVLAAGANCTVSVVFKPKTTGAKKGALIIQDSDPSSPQIVGMTGTGTSLVVLTPSSLTFPAQAVGTTSGLAKVTLTNNTGVSLTLSSPAVTATVPFAVGMGPTSCSNGQVVAAGQTCFIYVDFTPTSVGYPTGTLSVFDSDSTSPQTAPLSGTGTGVEFTPSSITFATSSVGHQVSAAVSITNVGTSTITFTAATITGPNASDFSTNNGDPPCKGSIAPGGLCSFTAYFTPSIVGTENATYVIYDNSTGGSQSLPLTGAGQ